MQPDTAPDLDELNELERLIAEARAYPMVGPFRMAGVEEPQIGLSPDVAEKYLRAARERDELRAVVSACHEAIGEHPASDDGTLAEGIALRLSDLRAVLKAAERERDELRAQALSTTKALALVEMALESAEGTRAVQRQTGGTAPESVQGILDGVVELRARAEKAEADLAESKRLVEKAEARAKELEALLSDAERVAGNAAAHWHTVEGPNLATVSGVTCPGCVAEEESSAALARIRAVLAQKPGAEGAGTARPSGPELKEPR